jgi:vitamin-K-epoxide reductase (warfarin-sensitive)
MRYFLLVLALAGIVVSYLALRVHYSTGPEICSINEQWDCGIVNHSPFAMLGPVPVAAIGIAGYVAMGILAFFKRKRVVLVAALAGLGFSLYLTHVEKDILMVYCIYCVTSMGIISVMSLSSAGWLLFGRKS